MSPSQIAGDTKAGEMQVLELVKTDGAGSGGSGGEMPPVPPGSAVSGGNVGEMQAVPPTSSTRAK